MCRYKCLGPNKKFMFISIPHFPCVINRAEQHKTRRRRKKAVSHTCIIHYYLPTTFYPSLFSLSSCTFFSNSANASSVMG